MNWFSEAKAIFNIPKPAHFTNFTHCDECAEHDQTLLTSDVDHIGLNELGNPGWDPICFCSPDGKKYYLPAMIRLSLDTVESDFYFDQLLFHLELDGENNALVTSCSGLQRAFIAKFIAYMIETHAAKIEYNCSGDQVLRVYEIWALKE
jgi:hypothetical protein